jgi:hypothetical protein
MRKWVLLLAVIGLLLPFAAVSAQDVTPSVQVADQYVFGNIITIAEVTAAQNGFMVIHIDNGGSPGAVIGFSPVSAGVNRGVQVAIETASATPVLYAMLHDDTGMPGVYEFGSVQGADLPVRVGGALVSPAFSVAIIDAHDQFVEMDTVTIDSVTAAQDGFLVVHAGDANRFGAVLGFTPISAGTTADVVVALAAEGRTDVLWPMLHVDTGVMGEYEFGRVQGVDGPVIIGGAIASSPIWTVPHIRASSQIVINGDNRPMEGAGTMADMMMAPSVFIDSALLNTEGFVVIHIDEGGRPGAVAGWSWFTPGYNSGIEVLLDLGIDPTPVLFPMLHADTGTVGQYEFGSVQGVDLPVRVGDAIVTFPINAAPALVVNDQPLGEGGTLVIAEALIDAQGWLVIHSDANGAPGPVIGVTALSPGLHRNVSVTLSDVGAAGSRVFPMLHYDTGVVGEYEFGIVQGADAPVRVRGNVIVVPLAITG